MFAKITFSDNRRPQYAYHPRGSQVLFSEIDRLIPGAIHTNGVPLALEIDGWADDSAAEGDTFETVFGLTVESISEDEYREATGQEDVPKYLLQ